MSSKCNPVVGSSRMYSVFPVPIFESSVESLTRWASPPGLGLSAYGGSTFFWKESGRKEIVEIETHVKTPPHIPENLAAQSDHKP